MTESARKPQNQGTSQSRSRKIAAFRERRRFRKSKPKRSRPLLEDLYNLPNILTYMRVLMIPVFLVALAAGDPKNSFVAAILFGLAAITDFLDGWLARKRNQISMMGKFLDPMADKLLVMAALIMLIPLERIPAWLVIVILAREMTISGLRSIASAEGMVMSAGTAGKFKTALQYPGISGLLLHYTYPIHFVFFTTTINFNQVGLALIYLSMLFSLYSAGEYFASFFKEVAKRRATYPEEAGQEEEAQGAHRDAP